MKFLKDERGVVGIIILSLTLPVFLLFMSFGLDFGRVFLLKHELQNAVDAASLAGASETTVVFETSEFGQPKFQKTVIDEDLADAAAEAVLEANLSIQGLTNQKVKIVSQELQKVDDERYSVKIFAEIPTYLVGPIGSRLFNDDSLKHITVPRMAVAKIALP